MELITDNRLENFKFEISRSKELRIISPFIQESTIKVIKDNFKGNKLSIVTRYNLNDFKMGVSSLKSLRLLIKLNAKIFGIKGLHSKVYIFDNRKALITSANLTNGGFVANYECGVTVENNKMVAQVVDYYNSFMSSSQAPLSEKVIDIWEEELKSIESPKFKNSLKDYGMKQIKPINKQCFVKFYGTAHQRAKGSDKVKDILAKSHFHFALTFPEGSGRPRRYQNDDIVYVAHMLEGGDYAIMGKVIAMEHVDNRDVASDEDIQRVDWKTKYPIYIRVHSGVFLDTELQNCPKLKDLMSELDYDSFISTQNRAKNGEENIRPTLSLVKKPDIRISKEGQEWLDVKFTAALKKYQPISDDFINDLYQGEPQI